jgi:hypothetical protein
VSITDEEVVKAKEFALAEIIKLSDSYRDMKINTVMSAETARSVSPALIPSISFCVCALDRPALAMVHGGFYLPLLFAVTSRESAGICGWNEFLFEDGARMHKCMRRTSLSGAYRVYVCECVCTCIRACVRALGVCAFMLSLFVIILTQIALLFD